MSPNFWVAVLAMSAATYLSRSVTLAFFPDLPLPRILRQGLPFVPVGVLAALVVPELLMPGGGMPLPWANPNLLAGIVATCIAVRTRSVPLTMLVGVVAVVFFRWWVG